MMKLDKKLKLKIQKMVELDMKMRKRADQGKAFDFSVDKKNTKELKAIIQKYGWPTIDLVGKKASWGAWLLAQHADHDKKFQKKCLKLIESVWKKNKASVSRANIAFLKDRILVSQKKKQLFGTQFYINKKGEMTPRPIHNLKTLDKRRKEFGLTPFKDYLDAAKRYKPKRVKG